MREKSGSPSKVSGGEPEWRIRAERKIFRLERLEDGHWSPVVAFAGSAGMCRDPQPE